MKKILKLFLFSSIFFIGVKKVYAAPTYTFYTSANYVEVYSSVSATIKLSNVASWNVKISSSGSTSGCTTAFADATSNAANTTKYLTVTCKATGVGAIGFVVTGDATSQDGSTTTINSSKTVTVTAAREKDSNNYLKSIGVTGYTLTPEFNKDTMEYSVDVPPTVDKVTLEAAAASSYASLTGTGEVEVNEGANTFEIKVTSETGVERIYKITVNVKDENPINIKISNSEYTIMKNMKNIEAPSTYEATTVKINDFDIPAFYSDTTKLTLVSVKDSKGEQHFAIYDAKKSTYELYNENKSNQFLLYILPITEEKNGFLKTKITINEQTYDCLKSLTGDTYLIYAMDILTGQKNYYIYDKENNSYVKYNETWINSYQEELDKYKKAILGFGGALIFAILIITILILKKSKKNKKQLPLPNEDKTLKTNKKEIENKKSLSNFTKEDAIQKMDDVTKMIDEYEKTISIDKKDLQTVLDNESKKNTVNKEPKKAKKKKKR